MAKDLPFIMGVVAKYTIPRDPAKAIVVHRIIILVLTFLAYMSYHMTRKSLSVVKTVLHRNCSEVPSNEIHNDTNWCDWVPFEGSDSDALLSSLDSSFLFSYAFAMFVSGVVAERVNLRYFLSMGMISSGLFCFLLGLAYSVKIHTLAYFIVIQIFFGIAQTTGWPAVVAIVGHWFGKGKRGLIFGIWNSHTSIGNILGSLIAGKFVESNWAFSFMVPGIIMAIVGLLIYFLLVVYPEDVGCQPTLNSSVEGINVSSSGYIPIPVSDSEEDSNDILNHPAVSHPACQAVTARMHANVGSIILSILTNIIAWHVLYALQAQSNSTNVSESSPILRTEPDRAIGFLGALRIPGVVEFSLSLFFAKLVSYTFLFWLPRYIKDSTDLDAEFSAYLSTLFDVGGIIGAIVAGTVSDTTHMPATTCVAMLISSIPSLVLYQLYGASNLATNITLLIVAGAFVNGPYALITTAVSAELGTHESLNGNAKALATVTAIIDGTGSIGAAVGPLLAGLVSPTGWQNVFYLLIASAVLALLLLSRLTYSEINKWRRRNHRSL